MDRSGGRVSIYLDVPSAPAAVEPAVLARLLEATAAARAVVMDLSQRSRDVVDAVAATGVPVWTDVHDFDGHSSFHAPFLRAASFVFMNGDRLERPQEFLRACVDRGARVAVCTVGAEGAIAMSSGHDLLRVPATPVPEVVDTNGAGDGFLAGFLAAHLDGADLAHALASGADQAARALGTVQLSPLLDESA